MKTFLTALAISLAAAVLTLAPDFADAARLGGGRPAGMQRSAPPQQAAPQQAAPATPAAPSPQAPAPAPGKRSWLGPIAGLAAGLGIAALFSHFGMGAGLASAMGSILTMLLVAGVAFFVIRFLMNRFGAGASRGGPQLAGAGNSSAGVWEVQPASPPVNLQRSALDAAPAALALGSSALAATPVLPGGMAAADFERLAKMVFIRLQAANDASNLDDLRKFTTPELFASLRLDLQDRGAAKQQTDVVQIDAQVVDTARENGQDIVTVRFHGLIREAPEAGAEPFNELWHLVRSADGKGDWAIAGITPVQ